MMVTIYDEEEKDYEDFMQKKYEEDEEAYQKAAGKAYSTWLKEYNEIKWEDLSGGIHLDYRVSEIWSEEPSAGILFGGISITRYEDDWEELDTLYLYEKWNGKELIFYVGTFSGDIVGRVIE